MTMPNRSYSAGNGYRYGFNGKENSPEISSGAVSYEARVYDSRLGRFFSTDPMEVDYAWQSTYAYFSNCPISVLDILGMGGPPTEGGDKPKKVVNILLAQRSTVMESSNDFKNNIWVVFKFTTLEQGIKDVNDYLKKNNAELGNLAIQHHGNKWATESASEVKLGGDNFKYFNEEYEKYKANEKYKDKTFQEYYKGVVLNGQEVGDGFLSEVNAQAYQLMRDLFSNIKGNGNLLLLGCSEGTNEGSNSEISKAGGGSINVYTNTNVTSSWGAYTQSAKGAKIQSVAYGGYFYIGLTSEENFYNPLGWKYYNCQTKIEVGTKQDLVMQTAGQAFKLVNHKSISSEYSRNQSLYHSKSYERYYKTNWGESAYKTFLNGVKKLLK